MVEVSRGSSSSINHVIDAAVLRLFLLVGLAPLLTVGGTCVLVLLILVMLET